MPSQPRHLNEAQFQKLLEVAPDAFVLTRSDGTIARVNRQTEQLFGYRREELLGQPVEILLPERFHQQHRGHRSGYHASPRIRTMGAGLKLAGRRKDGTEFPVDISLGPIKTEEGLLYLAAVRDATERKHAEAMARRLAQEQQERRQALELNDGVVQGLVAAKLALELGDVAWARQTLQSTLASARALINELLSHLDEDGGLNPGDLVRSHPALLERD